MSGEKMQETRSRNEETGEEEMNKVRVRVRMREREREREVKTREERKRENCTIKIIVRKLISFVYMTTR